MTGGRIGPHVAVADNPALWTSKYGSLVKTVYGVGTPDGFNKKAFAVHMLYLTATEFGPRDETKLDVQAGRWGQYLALPAMSVPFGAPNNEPGTLYNIEYRTAMDLTSQLYFFRTDDDAKCYLDEYGQAQPLGWRTGADCRSG